MLALGTSLSGCAPGPGAPLRRMLVLPVPGYGDARIVTPATTRPVPLVVAVHGSWDRPEWICEQVDKAVRGRAWVLCIRGVRRPEEPADGPRWTLGKPTATLAEIEAAVRALKAKAQPWIRDGPWVLAGFSKGAYQAGVLAAREPTRFPRLLLHEGGQSSLTGRRLRRFAAHGGARVAYGCGTRGCVAASERACRALRRRSVACRVMTDLRVGHSYNPPFEDMGSELFGWLLEGY